MIWNTISSWLSWISPPDVSLPEGQKISRQASVPTKDEFIDGLDQTILAHNWGAFRIPKVFQNKINHELQKFESYPNKLLRLIQEVRYRPEESLEGSVLEAILKEQGLDEKQLKNLLKDIYHAYNLNPAKGSARAKDSIQELRNQISDDAKFVEYALNFSQAFDLSPDMASLWIIGELSETSRKNLNLMLPLLAQGGGNWHDLKYLLERDPVHFEQLALESLEFFKSICDCEPYYADKEVFLTKELAEKAIQRNQEWYAYLPEKLKKIESLKPPWWDQKTEEEELIKVLTASEREKALEILAGNPSLYRKVNDAKFLNNPQIMEIAARDPENFPLLSKQSEVPRDLVLKAVATDGRLLNNVKSETFLKDPEIIHQALQNDATAIYAVHPSQRYSREWYPLLKRDPRTLHLTKFPHGLKDPGRVLRADYKKMLSDRDDLEARLEKNPTNPDHPDKPIALMIYPISDHNKAFNEDRFDKLQNAGFKVVYYEVFSEEEYIRLLRHYLPLLREQDVVASGGHGTREGLHFSGNEYYVEGVEIREEQYYLDLGDEEQLMAALPEEWIHPGVTHLNLSCSNGRGGNKADNLMNMFYRVYRSKWHVFALNKADNSHFDIENSKVKLRGEKSQTFRLPPENAPMEILEPIKPFDQLGCEIWDTLKLFFSF